MEEGRGGVEEGRGEVEWRVGRAGISSLTV